jgi:uncharacterized protein YoxC
LPGHVRGGGTAAAAADAVWSGKDVIAAETNFRTQKTQKYAKDAQKKPNSLNVLFCAFCVLLRLLRPMSSY